MDLFEIDNVNSNEFHDSVRSRMKLHVPKIIKQFHANLSLNESESERKKYIEKMIAYAFGYMQHAKLREYSEYLGNKLYKISTESESCLVHVLIIENNEFINDLHSSDLTKNECSPKYIVETNFDLWRLHEITENQTYNVICESNLKINVIDNFINNSIQICKESTSVNAITDKYNRRRVYNYFDDNKSLIEVSVQFEFILFEDDSEMVWLPKYKETFWSKSLIGSRINARVFIEKSILNETGKIYKIENQSESLDLQNLNGIIK